MTVDHSAMNSSLPPEEGAALLSSLGPSQTLAYPAFHSFIGMCNQFAIPVMIVAGIVGNLITFLVFVFSPLKRLSSSVFLAALAFADSGFLVSLGASWANNFRFTSFNKKVSCTWMVYVTYVFSFLSVWLVVGFTVHMYLALFHKAVAARLSHPTIVRSIVCLLTVFCSLLYLHTFWTTEEMFTADGKETCDFVANQGTRIAITLTDSFLTLILPFSLLVFMNTRIFFVIAGFSHQKHYSNVSEATGGEKLTGEEVGIGAETPPEVDADEADSSRWTREIVPASLGIMQQQRKEDSVVTAVAAAAGGGVAVAEKGKSEINTLPRDLASGGSRADPLPVGKTKHAFVLASEVAAMVENNDRNEANGGHPRKGRITSIKRKSVKMLFTVATVFLLLNLPSHVIRLQGILRSFFTSNYVTTEIEYLLQQLFQILYYLNFVLNFVIYNACAKQFRAAVLNLPLSLVKECQRCSQSCSKLRLPVLHKHRIGQELRDKRELQHSRLVEFNFAELHISKMEPFASDFKYHSPPCLLRVSDNE